MTDKPEINQWNPTEHRLKVQLTCPSGNTERGGAFILEFNYWQTNSSDSEVYVEIKESLGEQYSLDELENFATLLLHAVKIGRNWKPQETIKVTTEEFKDEK